ncbi:efflux RND transporter periplasmic adaptor subunit [Algoriphagus sp. H41]|uniref:Efflux RND transporter periplasmic adaptor subunit n=1 Tax=Algoriphagus oliviformis TaxID=2811231 RepID=A0ABS3C0H2_9BACT|nr:efflux RND transporter periplasmic adaptor subunit [Algoriphagus oliviformis]MBN7810423.1 efflux RND transporter periplasmic adaptor subunit [Algoriphagus oliviformis]
MRNLLFGLSLLFFACSEAKDGSQEIPAESFRSEVAATEVRTATAERKSFDYLVNAIGKLEAQSEVKALVEREGYLEEVLVLEGHSVQKGQLIARLDRREAEFAVEKARIAVVKAQSELEVLKNQYHLALESQDTAVAKLVQNRILVNSGLSLAEVELKEAELNLARCEVRAPVSGQIANIKFKQGSLVTKNAEFAEILSTDQLLLRVKVLESDIPLVSSAQKAEVYPISDPQNALVGTVTAINPKVDENGLVQVSLTLNSSKNLLPGMNARAVIRAPQSNSLVVPKDAVVYRSGRAVVFTVEGGKESKWNYVEVGKDNGREIEILEGIPENSTVITSNNLQLAHQAPIQIANDTL